MLLTRLNAFITKNNILKEAHIILERRNGKIIARLIHNYPERIHKAIDKKISPTGNFFVFSKAYDVSNHNILACKLDTYGIKRVTKVWSESYLLISYNKNQQDVLFTFNLFQ